MDTEFLPLLRDIVSWSLILAGSFFLVVGGIGLMRLPDIYTRMHATGISETLATGLIVAGLMVQGGFTLVSVKLFLILVFIFFTSPTSTHAVAKAAKGSRLQPLTGAKKGKRWNP